MNWFRRIAARENTCSGARCCEAKASATRRRLPELRSPAWQRACQSCAHVLVQGVQMRYQGGTANGTAAFRNWTVCHNVYASVVTAGSESASKLATEAGTIAGWVYKRALGTGMSACK